MKKYKITVAGRGAEVYVHKIDDEQKKLLQDMNLEDEDVQVDWDKLTEVLNVDNWDYSDEVYTGCYTSPTAHHIIVVDDEDNTIWESDEDYEMEGLEDEDYVEVNRENVLIIEHSVKGDFMSYVIETEEDFNSDKLSPIITEINEAVQIVTGLRYDGKKLEIDEWGDNWSKGAYFYIS